MNNSVIPKKNILLKSKVLACFVTLLSFNSHTEVLQSSTISLVDTQHNSNSWAALNLLDANANTHWLSSKQSNDINFKLSEGDDAQCLSSFKLNNYGNNTTSLKQFMLLTTTYESLSGDAGTAGWRPMVADSNPSEKIDYLSWAQGARLISVDSQHNSREWSAEHLNDGSSRSIWLSNKSNNVLEYAFDSDWNGDTGNGIPINEIEVINYGSSGRSVKELQIEVTTDGIVWNKLKVPGSEVGDADFTYSRWQNGGKLGVINSQLNSNSWAAHNLQDGDVNTRWLSSKSNNTIEFTFDPNNNGTSGAQGDVDDLFTFDEIRFENYGTSGRSVKEFQVAVQTLANPNWQKLDAPNAIIGEQDYNFALSHNGAVLVEIDSQHNSTNWAAKNIHDGDANSSWLSSKGNNTLAFQFDVDDDGTAATVNDRFTFDRFYLKNYGNNDRSIKAFQLAVKTATDPTWQKIKVPGSTIGTTDYNFALSHQGGVLAAIDSQHNSSNWAAKNLHDGDPNSRWLSSYGNNTLDFQFDLDQDGVVSGVGDLFTLASFELINFGVDNMSVNQFQVEVKTTTNTNWSKLPVEGTSAGEPDYPFSLAANGASLSSIDSQHNTSSYAAKNIHDGDVNSRWLSGKQNNTLEFTFDTNGDGSSGDAINIDKITFVNYGNNNISVQTFEIDIQVSGGIWQTIDSPSGGTVFTATKDSSVQTWSIVAYNNVTAARIRTLSNYGDSSYTGAKELTFSGDSIGPSYTFTAAKHKNGETFLIDPVNQPSDVTDVRFRTINNHGDSSYIGASEFKILGVSVTHNYTFNAAMNGDGETFVLDNDDVPIDVTDVKLVTINNHGDSQYIAAKEFKLLGSSITKSKIFSAAMHGDPQIFTIAPENVPASVTALKLITISNHGDNSYTGIQEFSVVGASVTPSNTFTLPNSAQPYNIVLDLEDSVTDIKGVRIHTIQNYGDDYTGLAELKLLGEAITPSYVFTAQMISGNQTFDIEPTMTQVLRFHSLNNHGNSSYIAASDFSAYTGVCKSALWHMDEASWSGAIDEVLDSTGSGYNGTAFGFNVGDDPTTANLNSAIVGDPGTCSYAEFDGIDDYIRVDTGEVLDDLDEVSVSAWIKASSFTQTNGADSRGIFSQGAGINGELSYAAFFTNTEGSRLTIDIDGDNDRFVSNSTFNVDTWYHLALVFDGKQAVAQRVKLYINGVLDGTFAETSSTIPDTQGDFYIGNLFSSLNEDNVFDGAIDEVNIRPIALMQSEINYLMNSSQSCTVPLHHIEIEHDGSGLTCSSENLTIKACKNADCSELYPSAVNVTLSATGSNSTWSQNPVTIPAGESVSIDLSHTTAETITLSAATNIITQYPLVCAPNCNLEFANSGYLTTLENHTACSSASFTIEAVKLSDTSSRCAPAYTGNQSVDFTFNYASPLTGDTVPILAGVPMADAANSQTRTLNFDANGTATLDFTYQDAGQINIVVSDPANLGLASSTVTSVVSPAKLIVESPDLNADCAAGDASCSAFAKAEQSFNLSISAACSDGTITPNFEMNNIPLTVNTVAPMLGNPVSLAVDSINFTSSDEGVVTEANQAISEVGVFTITATPPINSYFGETIAAATSPNIGRFTPAYYELVVNENGVLGSGNSFVYSGQMTTNTSTVGQLSYLVSPEFNIIAKSLSASTTLNYESAFVKLQLADISRITPLTDTTQLGADATNKLALVATLNTASLSDNAGVLTYQYALDDHFVYTRDANALVAPFVSDIELTISAIIDSDSIAAIDIDADDSNGVLTLTPFGEEVRFGRWYVENSFGAETSPVNVAMSTQYWHGSVFTSNSMDNFTPFNKDSDFTITDISLAPATTSIVGTGNHFFSGGKASIVLSAPGEGMRGDVSLSIDVPPWLQYNWSNLAENEPFIGNPAATVSFGLYRGDDRMIHWREVFN